MISYPAPTCATGQYYTIRGYRGRAETLKVVHTPRGRRMICIHHSRWPIQGTRCFSLSLRQVHDCIANGHWVHDPVLSNPDLQVSEGL